MRLPDLSEDRGDGRSRLHALHLDVRAVLHLTVQRDGARYVATVTRLGHTYPRGTQGHRSFAAGTLEEAVRQATDAMGCRVGVMP
jgi:hypothetical protein